MSGEPDIVVRWEVPAAHAEDRCAQLWAAGAAAVEWSDGPGGSVTLVAGMPTAEAAHRVAAELGAQALEIDPATWRDEWRRHATAVEVAPGLVVAPTWKEIPAGPLVLRIDPGHCFGSGSHPSTRLVLAALAETPPTGLDVLDIGTGSGILAVAAARLGAASVTAVDIEADAVPVTEANAAANGVAGRVAVSTTPVEQLRSEHDLVLVNVTAGVHAAIGPAATARARPGARLILAGLLPGQWRHVAANYGACRVVEHRDLDGWEGLILRR